MKLPFKQKKDLIISIRVSSDDVKKLKKANVDIAGLVRNYIKSVALTIHEIEIVKL